MSLKKLLFFVSLTPFFSFGQMLEEGDGVAEFSIGFPNFRPTIYDQAGFFHSGFDFFDNNSKAFGQFVLKGEYMVSDKMGIAGALNYSFYSFYNTATWDEWDPQTQTYNSNSYFYESKVHKLRLAVGINFHAIRTSRVDSYFGFLAGGKRTFLKYRTNDPSITSDPTVIMFPFALRVHYGLRIFLNEFLAINMELGLGGTLINGGLTYKF